MKSRFPQWLRGTPLERYVLHFEASIERAVAEFAAGLAPGSRVLDAGAGEVRHGSSFQGCRYVGVDLGVGDSEWDYRRLDAVADLAALPFAQSSFEACLNIVTLEHVREPAAALREIARVLRPAGRLLLVVPNQWEVHQAPYDYYRYTRYGMQYLLEAAGFTDIRIKPAGGFFRMLGRRMLNALQFFPPPLVPVAGILLAPAGLLLPLLDFLDRERHFTLGYICTARKFS